MTFHAIFEEQLTNSQEWESGRIDLWVVSGNLLFGVPGIVHFDELHNLEVQSSIPLGYELSSDCFFSLFCARTHALLQSILIILGPDVFFHERTVMGVSC